MRNQFIRKMDNLLRTSEILIKLNQFRMEIISELVEPFMTGAIPAIDNLVIVRNNKQIVILNAA